MPGLLRDLVNYCVPRPEDKVRMTSGRSPYIIATFLTLVTLAALARQPGTRFLRLAILPSAVILTLRLTYGFVWWDIPLNGISFVAGAYSILMIMKALQLGLSPNGILKLGEKVPGEITLPASDLVVHDPPKRAVRAPGSLTLVEHFLSGLEVLTCARGIGWEFGSGTKIQIPPETRDVSDTSKFLRIGTPDGGSIFVFGQNTMERYLISALLHLITSLSLIYTPNIMATCDQHHRPHQHIHAFFWARDWHQLFRQTFLILGGYPFQAIFGPSGLLWGAFLASGVLHVWALVTKRRVGGFFGWIWVWLWLQVFGQFLSGGFVPPAFSPTRNFLLPKVLPYIQPILQKYFTPTA
ncbi:hypothetical protein BS47DRAFT_1364097 [Hydnum rufescens UP504]|uniref:Wax synthase domain-containing protein n=1 Tax=Hydnum rufescens UP504 TaxID=1448309 RepID=A0A9P6AT99_9AGAM|nr:hypothetical protein BS47DRAFT_1364097 [Hydnum rufescens UP504]